MRFLTAGESHGPVQVAIVEGLPAGLPVRIEAIDRELARRQAGHGRGQRQRIEHDRVKVLAGIRNGFTTGAPVMLQVDNKDAPNWAEALDPRPVDPDDQARLLAIARRRVSRVRPGHADLAGALKYAHDDVRDVLERASARETVSRVLAGALAGELLGGLGIQVASHVIAIGDVTVPASGEPVWDVPDWRDGVERSPVRCACPDASLRMVEAIDAARLARESLGGVVEVVAIGVPPGLGSYVHWDRRLDGRLAQAIMSIPAVKGVEFGAGFACARLPGSRAHDPILPGFERPSHRAGGLEGGVTNGQPLILRFAKKPIPTLMNPLPSVDLHTGHAVEAHIERADTCAVPASGVIAEAMVRWVLAEALLEKLGGDSWQEVQVHHRAWLERHPFAHALSPDRPTGAWT